MARRAGASLATLLAACTSVSPASDARPIDGGRDADPISRADAGPRPDGSIGRDAPDLVWPPPPLPTTVTPLPASGGTLAVSRAGDVFWAADPERDRLDEIAIGPSDELTLGRRVLLPEGSEAGRVIEDGAGRIHVALRAGGGIATIEPGSTLARVRDTCATPRGLAWRAEDDMLWVACADGVLVELPAAGGAPTRRLPIDDDLRDVVIAGGLVLVSRFRSSEVLAIDAGGDVVARWTPATVVREDALSAADLDPRPTVRMEPHVAWRMVPAPGGAWLLHQRARVEPIAVAAAAADATPAYGTGAITVAGGCSPSVVEVTVSFVDAAAPSGLLAPSPALPIALATDLTVGDDGWVFLGGPVGGARCSTTLLRVGVGELRRPPEEPPLATSLDFALGITSVARTPSGRVLSFRTTPAIGIDLDDLRATGREVPLGPEDRSRGDELFAVITPSGLSCATCHPEGGDDGHVWALDERRVRTQGLRGHLLDTLPFHWAGDVPSLARLMNDAFVRRMGGFVPSWSQFDALSEWLDALPALPPPRVDVAAAERGRALFESDEVGCASCHSGHAFTDGRTLDVGTGGAFQVAVLSGLAYRAPYMHDGCAATLRDVVAGDETCRGSGHGATLGLAEAEIDDLVTYLRSL